MGPYYTGNSDSTGLYGSSSSFGGTYFEWFIFQQSATAPATPTGGSWSFATNVGTPPAGWSSTPPASPTNTVWISIALVNSRNANVLTWSVPGQVGVSSETVTSVTGTAPVASSGGRTPAISLAASYGDTQNPYASKTANFVLAAPNGSVGTPTFRAIVAADVPTLNQNTTGTSANVTGTVAIANGGTGASTRQNAINALTGSTELGQYLRGNGTNVVMSGIQAADIPTLNQNTTGTAANVTGLVSIFNGGTGTTTPSLVAGVNVTISGAWPNQTINASGGGASPGGSNTQVQYNNAGVFAGSSAFTFNGTSISVNGVVLGKGSGTGASNDNSTSVGNGALLSNVVGEKNTAVGFSALTANTTGTGNTAVGANTLPATNGNFNTAIGLNALLLCTTGSDNTVTGRDALTALTTGSNNSALGSFALSSTNTGVGNSALGYGALNNNTSGSYNSALGFIALLNNTTGSGNTAINPTNNSGTYVPVFDPTTQNNRFCMGSTAVTNAYIQVAWTVVSDARDKTDFAPVPHGLDFVNQLKPTAYRYKETRESIDGHGPLRYGFKAQDVLKLEGNNPVIVDAEDLEKLRFNDQSMMAVLVNAIQELSEKFEAYKATHP
jgi:hypothetical protein